MVHKDERKTVMRHLSAVYLSISPEWAGQWLSRKRMVLKQATLMLVFAASSVAGQLFQENFAGAVPGGGYSYGPIPGTQFTVTGGNVDVVGVIGGSYFSCVDHPSGNCLDLIGSGGSGGISSVPTFNLTPGTTYIVKFGVVAQGVTANIQFSVGIGPLFYTVTATPSPQQITLVFANAARYARAHLTFYSVTNLDNVHGAVLDNIVLSSVESVAPSVLPQFVSGGGWYSALYFTNTNAAPVSFAVNFIGDDGNPLNVPVLAGSSAVVRLPAHGTGAIQTANVGPLSQGYASVARPGGVWGYGLFHLRI